MHEENISITESAGMFNTLSVEIRSKIDDLVKQILFLSGGIQAITIGAFLSGTPPQFHPHAIELLKFGWLALSVCMVLCLMFMLGQVLAMTALGFKLKGKIEQSSGAIEVMFAPFPFRLFNWVIGLLAFVSCGIGIITLSMAAMALIDNTSA